MNSKKIDIPRKAWVHKSGAIVPIPDEDFVPEDHGVFAVKNPEKFGMSHEQMRAAVGDDREYTRMKENRGAWSESVNRAMNNLGWMRLVRSTDRNKDGSKHHTIMLSHESSKAHPHDFIEPLRAIKPHLASLPENDSFGVSLSGFDLTKTHRDDHLRKSGLNVPPYDQVALGDMNKVNKYIGEAGGTRSREPERPAAAPTSTDIRAAIGPKPESMPMAQYNFMRTIGDSYEPCKFNSLLEKIGNSKISLNESGGKSILGENPMQLTPRKLKRVLKKWKTHISVEEGSKHIRIISNATGNLVAVVSKSKELGPKTSIKTLTDVRNHLASIGAYTPEENESRGNITRRQNRVVDTSSKNTGPSVEDLKSRRDRLKDIVLARLGQKRQERVVKALANTEKQISQASSN